jgi:hypothetical protein
VLRGYTSCADYYEVKASKRGAKRVQMTCDLSSDGRVSYWACINFLGDGYLGDLIPPTRCTRYKNCVALRCFSLLFFTLTTVARYLSPARCFLARAHLDCKA